MSAAKKPHQIGNWNLDLSGERVSAVLDLDRIRQEMVALEERATLAVVLQHLRERGFEITDPQVEAAKKTAGVDRFDYVEGQDLDLGWWEWGVQIYYTDGRPAQPHWYGPRGLAEEHQQRYPDKQDLIKRWVTPGAIETVIVRSDAQES